MHNSHNYLEIWVCLDLSHAVLEIAEALGEVRRDKPRDNHALWCERDEQLPSIVYITIHVPKSLRFPSVRAKMPIFSHSKANTSNRAFIPGDHNQT